MIDISKVLDQTMQQKECSSLYALLCLTRSDEHVDILQPEPAEEVSRRLRNKGNIKINRTGLGAYIYRNMFTGVYVE